MNARQKVVWELSGRNASEILPWTLRREFRTRGSENKISRDMQMRGPGPPPVLKHRQHGKR